MVELNNKLAKKLAGLSAVAEKYKAPIDLTQVPDEDLKREYMRRLNATRRRGGGRPVQMKACPNCGSSFPATTLRLVHLPECRRVVDPRASAWPSIADNTLVASMPPTA